MAKKNSSKQLNKSHKKTKNGGVGKQAAAFRIFFGEQQTQRTDLNSMAAKEQMKILKTEWKKLSPQQKQSYLAKIPAETLSVKTKRAGKHQSHVKTTGKKKTHAKKTKRMGHKSTAHPDEHCETETTDDNHHE